MEPFGSETGERWIEAGDGDGKPDAINRGETGSAESEGDEPLSSDSWSSGCAGARRGSSNLRGWWS